MRPIWKWLEWSILIVCALLRADSTSADDFGVVLSGAWSSPATWTPAGGPPTASDKAYIGTGFPAPAIVPATVQLDADAAAEFVSVGQGALDLNGHTLTSDTLLANSAGGPAQIQKSGGHLDLGLLLLFGGSTLTIDAGDQLAQSAQLDGPGSELHLDRPLELADGVAVVAGGVVHTSAPLNMLGFGLQIASAEVNAGADITASSTFFGAGITNNGVLNLNGHTLTAGVLYLGVGKFQVAAGLATLNRGTGGNVQLGSIDVNSGNSFAIEAIDSLSQNIRVAGPGSTLTLNRDLTLSGAVDVAMQGTLDINGHTLETAGSMSLVDGGRLTGSGVVVGSLQNGGVVSPGNGIGILSVEGSFEQLGDGIIQFELGGTDNSQPLSAEYDQLVVDGTASLGGFLTVSLAPSYSPALGDEFPILTATDGIQMAFDDVTLPGLAPGLQWQVDSSDPHATLLRVKSALVGDYNANGVVDAADYTVWRNTLGQSGTGLAADGSGNGQVGDEDYVLWKQNFGAPLGAGSGAGSVGTLASRIVPEPASFLLTTLAIAAIFLKRRTSNRQFAAIYRFDNNAG